MSVPKSYLGGVRGKAGYAFGLGLERWAMKLYAIPDIRLFWSKDPGFLHQFEVADINQSISYKVVLLSDIGNFRIDIHPKSPTLSLSV